MIYRNFTLQIYIIKLHVDLRIERGIFKREKRIFTYIISSKLVERQTKV